MAEFSPGVAWECPAIWQYETIPQNEVKDGGDYVIICDTKIYEKSDFEKDFAFNWTYPNITNMQEFVIIENESRGINPTTLSTKLTVINWSKAKHSGDYICVEGAKRKCPKELRKDIRTAEEKHGIFNLSVTIVNPSGAVPKLEVDSSKNSTGCWNFRYESYPSLLNFRVLHEDQEIRIMEEKKYRKHFGNGTAEFCINVTDVFDSGEYSFQFQNIRRNETKKSKLMVRSEPIAEIIHNTTYTRENEIATFECKCFGYPPCQPEFIYMSSLENDTKEELPTTSDICTIIETSFLPVSSPEVTCKCTNDIGTKQITKSFPFSDLKEPVEILENIREQRIHKGDPLNLTCGAHKDDIKNFDWYFKNTLINETENIKITTSETKYSRRKQISWKKFSNTDFGVYDCKGEINTQRSKFSRNLVKDVKIIKDSIVLMTEDTKLPEIEESNMQEKERLALQGENVSFLCKITGNPMPSIIWYKDNVTFAKVPGVKAYIYKTKNSSSILELRNITEEYQGEYKCEGFSRFGNASKIIFLRVNTPRKNSNLVLIEDVIQKPWYKSPFVVSSTVVGLCMLIGILTTIALVRDRIAEKLHEKELWIPESESGPLLKPEEYLDLPVVSKFRYPSEILILKDKNADKLGSGAFGTVYKCIAKGIGPNKDDLTVAVKEARMQTRNEAFQALTAEFNVMRVLEKHINVVNLIGVVTDGESDFKIIVEFCENGNMRDFLRNHRDNFENDFNTGSIFNGEKTCIFNSSDLIAWCVQVTKGMEFLSSHKLFHCDLAARNILLCSNNIIKICDFGLAKIKRETDYYKSKSGNRLPFRWLPIEAITDRVFSRHTDIWSFGIVMWEFFSLGEQPYSNLQNDELIQKIKDGHRLEKPRNATEDLYEIMLKCWQVNHSERPTFTYLKEQLSQMVESNYNYISLDYTRPNSHKSDYLEKIYISSGPPIHEAPPVPSRNFQNVYVLEPHRMLSTEDAKPLKPVR